MAQKMLLAMIRAGGGVDPALPSLCPSLMKQVLNSSENESAPGCCQSLKELLQAALKNVARHDSPVGRLVVLSVLQSTPQHHKSLIRTVQAFPNLISECLLWNNALSKDGADICSQLLELVRSDASLVMRLTQDCIEVLTGWAEQWREQTVKLPDENLPSLAVVGTFARILLSFPEISSKVMESEFPTVMLRTLAATHVDPTSESRQDAEDVAKLLMARWSRKSSSLTLAFVFGKLNKTNLHELPLAASPFMQQQSRERVRESAVRLSSIKSDTALERSAIGIIRWLWWPGTTFVWPMQVVTALREANRIEVLGQLVKKLTKPLFDLIRSAPERRFWGSAFLITLLLGYRESPDPFHSILPAFPDFLQVLRQDADHSGIVLKILCRLVVQMMYVFPGFSSLYDPIKKAMGSDEPKLAVDDVNHLIQCAWTDTGLQTVNFSWAESGNQVYLAGLTKHGWTKDGWQLMTKTADGSLFHKQVKLKVGMHQYKFLVDGIWKCDPKKPTVTNELGITNNIIEVLSPHTSEQITSPRLGAFHRHRPGLRNLGNTCYINAVMQALFSIVSFRSDILCVVSPDETGIIGACHELFAYLTHSNRSALSIPWFVNKCRPPWFVPGNQQDGTEFLGYLLDQLETEFKKKKSIEGEDPTSRIPTRFFEGKIGTASTCTKCGKVSNRVDTFNNISLAFDASKKTEDTLEEMIDRYLKPEELCGTDRYECNVCGLQDGSRQFSFQKLPDCLVISLMRFAYDRKTAQRTKIMTNVKLPPNLAIPISENGIAKYSKFMLKAAVIHSGSGIASGHYYTVSALSNDPGSEWILSNDSSVSNHGVLQQILDTSSKFMQDTPYILFYEKVESQTVDTSSDISISSALKARISADNRMTALDRERKRKSSPKDYSVRSLPRPRDDDDSHGGNSSQFPRYVS